MEGFTAVLDSHTPYLLFLDGFSIKRGEIQPIEDIKPTVKTMLGTNYASYLVGLIFIPTLMNSEFNT